MDDNFEIDIKNCEIDFEKFIGLSNNNRIIFSGIFGIGKTYFLRKFFEGRKEKYFSIHLHPVNYVISKNEDIFEYIKYDILLSLFDSDIDHKLIIDKYFPQSNKLRTELPQLLLSLIEKISSTGKKLIDFGKSLSEIIKLIRSPQDDKVSQSLDDFIESYKS